MSDTALTDRVDTSELMSSIDYEELFEGTELEEDLVFDNEKSTAEALGGAIGAFIGRQLGEMLAKQLEEAIKDSLSRDGEEGEAEEEEETEEGEAEEEEEEIESESEKTEDAEQEGEEDEDVESLPENADDLADLSYRQLQSLAKEHDIQANLSREELTQELSEALGIE